MYVSYTGIDDGWAGEIMSLCLLISSLLLATLSEHSRSLRGINEE